MPTPGRSSRPLSTRATLALLGVFAVVALLAWGLSARSAAQAPAASPPATAAAATAAAATPPSRPGTAAAPQSRPGTSAAPQSRPGDAGALRPPGPGASVRAKALYVLAVVDATGSAPSGYVGGRQFLNDTRGGTTALPHQDGAGRVITYHEYDVNPHESGVNRGPQRLVVGSDGSAWTTADHYVTWQRLR